MNLDAWPARAPMPAWPIVSSPSGTTHTVNLRAGHNTISGYSYTRLVCGRPYNWANPAWTMPRPGIPTCATCLHNLIG
jgi:hypothetical protein